jgi:hypothetical protein
MQHRKNWKLRPLYAGLIVVLTAVAVATLALRLSRSARISIRACEGARACSRSKPRSDYGKSGPAYATLQHDESHHEQLRLADNTFILHRAAPVVALEADLDSSAASACIQGEPAVPALPAAACKPLVCLWSTAVQDNVDLWLHAFTLLPDSAATERCPLPSGGQNGALVQPASIVEVGSV